MKNYIDFEADSVRFYVLEKEQIIEEQVLEIGTQTIVNRFFKQVLTTEIEAENAINFIEDELMRHKIIIDWGRLLLTKDPSLNKVLNYQSNAVRHFSREDVEELFNQQARILRREPSQMTVSEWNRVEFAKVLMLREIMHHLNFETIEFID